MTSATKVGTDMAGALAASIAPSSDDSVPRKDGASNSLCALPSSRRPSPICAPPGDDMLRAMYGTS